MEGLVRSFPMIGRQRRRSRRRKSATSRSVAKHQSGLRCQGPSPSGAWFQRNALARSWRTDCTENSFAYADTSLSGSSTLAIERWEVRDHWPGLNQAVATLCLVEQFNTIHRTGSLASDVCGTTPRILNVGSVSIVSDRACICFGRVGAVSSLPTKPQRIDMNSPSPFSFRRMMLAKRIGMETMTSSVPLKSAAGRRHAPPARPRAGRTSRT